MKTLTKELHSSNFERYLGHHLKMYFIPYAQKQQQELVMVALMMYFLA